MSRLIFSIIICNYNYQNFVGKAIESCLAQDFDRELFEIIVVDDGSTDGSREVIEAYSTNPNLKFVFQKNQGHASAVQKGLEIAKGEFICLLDSDDLFKENKLAQVYSRMNTYQNLPELFFLCHDALVLDTQANTYLSRWFERAGLHFGSNVLDVEFMSLQTISMIGSPFPFANPCDLVFSRKLLNLIMSQIDVTLWKRGVDSPICYSALLITGGVHYLAETLAIYRIHGDNFFAQTNASQQVNKVSLAVSARAATLLELLDTLMDWAATQSYSRVELQQREEFCENAKVKIKKHWKPSLNPAGR